MNRFPSQPIISDPQLFAQRMQRMQPNQTVPPSNIHPAVTRNVQKIPQPNFLPRQVKQISLQNPIHPAVTRNTQKSSQPSLVSNSRNQLPLSKIHPAVTRNL